MKKYSCFIISLFFSCFTYAQTIRQEINPPQEYVRPEVPSTSFAAYLRDLPLLPEGSKVLLYNGEEKGNQRAAYRVVDLDIGKRDLQQCADAIIRLRAEYLYEQKQYRKIHFNFTNGFRADYKKWAQGNRIRVDGNKMNWYSSKGEDYSYATFRSYLDIVFIYAGTASLSKELVKTAYSDLQPGDVFIQGGFPGHAVIVVDVAVHPATGKKYFCWLRVICRLNISMYLSIPGIRLFPPGMNWKNNLPEKYIHRNGRLRKLI